MITNVCDCARTEVKEMKHMPIMQKGQRPTVAIITSKYNEKLAVDAMMQDKTTFVKYKTEGVQRTLAAQLFAFYKQFSVF